MVFGRSVGRRRAAESGAASGSSTTGREQSTSSTCFSSTRSQSRAICRPNRPASSVDWFGRNSSEGQRLSGVTDKCPAGRPDPSWHPASVSDDRVRPDRRAGGSGEVRGITGGVRLDDRRKRGDPSKLGTGSTHSRRPGLGATAGSGSKSEGGHRGTTHGAETRGGITSKWSRRADGPRRSRRRGTRLILHVNAGRCPCSVAWGPQGPPRAEYLCDNRSLCTHPGLRPGWAVRMYQ